MINCMDLYQATKEVVEECLSISVGEKIVIITDEETAKIVDALLVHIDALECSVKRFVLEDYGDRYQGIEFHNEIKEALREADASIYAAQSMKGELESFRHPMLEVIKQNNHLRHAHMPNISQEVLIKGIGSDYSVVRKQTQKVYEYIKSAHIIHVSTPKGTDLTVELSPKIKWIPSDGHVAQGEWSNIPSGEVFTCAHKAEGVIVIDGILGDYFTKEFGLLSETPVTLRVHDSRVIDVNCDNEEIRHELLEYMKKDENANRIGEFAIGTNIGLKGLIGNLLLDEKFPGVHIAIGHGYPSRTGASWNSVAHCDAVMKECTIIVDGHKIMEKGEFLEFH